MATEYCDADIREMLEEQIAIYKAETEEAELAIEEDNKAIQRAADAAARLFGVMELFEKVLENLSPAEVTRARQINSAFKDSIDKSLPLRRVMFLEPVADVEVLPYGTEGPEFPRPSDHGVDSNDSEEPPEQLFPNFQVINPHPAILSIHMPEEDRIINFKLPNKPWADGMWRDMLICQPPCPELTLMALVWRGDKRQITTWVRFGEVGNTLGDLVDSIAKLEPRLPNMQLLTPRGYEPDETRLVHLARDKVLAVEEADKMVALCQARVEQGDEDENTELTGELGVLSEYPMVKGGKTQSDRAKVGKTQLNRFRRPKMDGGDEGTLYPVDGGCTVG